MERGDEHNSHLRLVAQNEGGTFASKAEATRGQPVQRHLKRRTALELRAAGLTYEDIAAQMRQMGFKTSAAGVSKIIRNALDQMVEESQVHVERIRQEDLMRIDRIMQVLWPKVVKGDMKAIKEFRACIDQRARLVGTYAAKKVEHYGRIEGVIAPEDREEIRRLNEAFIASGGTGMEVVDAEVVDNEAALGLPAGNGPD